MAIRKSTIKQQVIQTLMSQAPPGEQFYATIETVTGASPWLVTALERIPIVGIFMLFTRKYYFVTVTNSSLVVNRASFFTNRPKDVLFAMPIQQARISNVKIVPMWSSLRFQMPGKSKPTRLNVSRYWRAELEQLLGAVQQSGVLVG